MDLAQFASDNGYLLLALGLLVEGETAVLLATLAAHRGWLHLPVVFGMAFGVAWLMDQLLYWLGRWKGVALLARWRSLARAAVRARRLVLRYPHASVIGVRFAYGLRTAGPVLIGASGLPAWQFALLSALAAALWAGTLCSLGWLFSHALQQLLHYAKGAQLALLAVLALAALVAWLVARRRRLRR